MPKQMLPFHDHPLECNQLNKYSCPLCDEGTYKAGMVYFCKECYMWIHQECIERFLNHPIQCNHFLKIIFESKSQDSAKVDGCHYCEAKLERIFARCTICNISMDLNCIRNPPPRTICQPKHHKHSLTLLSRVVNFTCNACGLEGDRNPYVCLECSLMLHKDCLDLPRVISINRHDHRISHTFHLGQREGDWECGVCRKRIDWVYGGFRCFQCSEYAVHSKCATREEVWDGVELEDVPEEEEEINDPFKVINERDIIHFSHENHVLRLDENCPTDDHDNLRCWGCVLPINDDSCYKCVECDFSLHKVCANLPRKKRHLLHNHKLTLCVDEGYFVCTACETFSNGFSYKCGNIGSQDDYICDVRCGSMSEPFRHDLHPHPLYWTLERSKRCDACLTEMYHHVLSCMVCDYALCMKCATLPRKVKHRCDDHFLSLSQGVGNASGDLWCDICETKTDPSVRYYACDECGLSLHIDCVLGDFYYLKVGKRDPTDPTDPIDVLANNDVTRPLCCRCGVRCKFPFVVIDSTKEPLLYFCSTKCFKTLTFRELYPHLMQNDVFLNYNHTVILKLNYD